MFGVFGLPEAVAQKMVEIGTSSLEPPLEHGRSRFPQKLGASGDDYSGFSGFSIFQVFLWEGFFRVVSAWIDHDWFQAGAVFSAERHHGFRFF